MEKETVIKLLLLCGVCHITIRYCTHLGVTVRDVDREYERIFTERDGRLEL